MSLDEHTQHALVTREHAPANDDLLDYQAPRVESVLSPEDLERESLYAGIS